MAGPQEILKGLRKGEQEVGKTSRSGLPPVPPGRAGEAGGAQVRGLGLQMRGKPKVKPNQWVAERQFRKYFEKGFAIKGPKGRNLVNTLERRLDNVIRRAGFSGSHAQARQFILHGHVRVNGKKVNIPSYLVKVGDEVSIKDKMHQNTMVMEARNVAQSQNTVPWLELNREEFKAKVVAMPKREDVQTPAFNEQLIVELYSK